MSQEKQALIKLTQANLKLLDKEKVQIPTYDRSKTGQAWIHIGVGAFHRAHQAVYQDELLNKHGAGEWGICGMSLLKNDTMIRDILTKQDFLYTVIERTPAYDDIKVIGSIVNFLLVPDRVEESIEKLASKDTKIVSLTITESGYGVSQETNDLDTTQKDIKHDLENSLEEPQSTYGFLTAALAKRKERDLKPFTLLSCDNIQHNGKVLQKMLLKFLQLKDKTLYDWMKEYGAFPSSMVDRITPAFSKENLEILKNKCNLDDGWPVACEPFKQWVVEDNFPLGRPQWEEVGVQMVKAVDVYEKLKICVLNASHIAISFYSKICTYTYIDEALDDILLTRYVEALQDFEITPLLDPVPGINVDVYKQIVVDRFRNSAIKDTVQRVSSDGTGKFTKFLYPIIDDAIKKGSEIKLMTFIVACWCKLLTGIDEFGNKFQVVDPNQERLQSAALKGGKNPRTLLQEKDIFGDLGDNTMFVKLLSEQLASIYEDGAQNTLEKLLVDIH